jgi:hypothetical protein
MRQHAESALYHGEGARGGSDAFDAVELVCCHKRGGREVLG